MANFVTSVVIYVWYHKCLSICPEEALTDVFNITRSTSLCTSKRWPRYHERLCVRHVISSRICLHSGPVNFTVCKLSTSPTTQTLRETRNKTPSSLLSPRGIPCSSLLISAVVESRAGLPLVTYLQHSNCYFHGGCFTA